MEKNVTNELNALAVGAFTGHYTHSLDSKRRVTIPSEWREAAEHPILFVLPGVNFPCLSVVTAKEMAKRLEKVYETSLANAEAQQCMRDFFSRAQRVALDAQGRIRVKDELLDSIHIGSQVVLAGTGGRFELWSPEEWNKRNSLQQDQYKSAMAYIGF